MSWKILSFYYIELKGLGSQSKKAAPRKLKVSVCEASSCFKRVRGVRLATHVIFKRLTGDWLHCVVYFQPWRLESKHSIGIYKGFLRLGYLILWDY